MRNGVAGRKKKYITIDGESYAKEEWCKKYNISIGSVDYRMKVLGMSFEEALKTPKTRKGNIFAGDQARARVKDINKCSSYIEANLYLAFDRLTSDYKLIPQYKVGKYRCDFVVEGYNILVECDGYDNHKTKEQLTHDCQRDRYLAGEGYTVLRFSGSEINSNPDECAKDILKFIVKRCGARDENWETNIG